MTKKEAGSIIDRLSRLYMLQMKKLTKHDIMLMVDTWADTFKDTPYQTVLDAVNIYANKGKSFLPGPPDIIAEILRLEERKEFKLYDKLTKAVDTAVNGVRRIVVVDPGGVRWSEAEQRYMYYHAECAWTTGYTASDFSNLPIEIQIYAEDIDGLRALKNEIDSDPVKARRRFIDALPYIRTKMKEALNADAQIQRQVAGHDTDNGRQTILSGVPSA